MVERAVSALHINTEPGARRPEAREVPTDAELKEELVDVLPGLLRISAVTVAHTAGRGHTRLHGPTTVTTKLAPPWLRAFWIARSVTQTATSPALSLDIEPSAFSNRRPLRPIHEPRQPRRRPASICHEI
jgi:hypothetical protein